MKKYILLTLFLISLGLALFTIFSLNQYENIVVVNVNRGINAKEINNLVGYDITDYSVVQRLSGISLRAGEWSSSSVSLYKCADSLNSVLPHKILYGDFQAESIGPIPSIVIDSEIAWRFFSRIDCVGSVINVAGQDYSISGVYQKNGLFSLLASRERYMLYTAISHREMETEGDKELVFKCRDGLAPVVLSKLLPLDCQRQVNIDAIARSGQFWSLLFILLTVLFFIWFNGRYFLLDRDLSVRRRVIHGGIALAAVIALLYTGSRLQFAPDPRMIPDSLIDLDRIKDKLEYWYSGLNNALFSGGMYYAGVKMLSDLSKIISFISVLLAVRVMKLFRPYRRD